MRGVVTIARETGQSDLLGWLDRSSNSRAFEICGILLVVLVGVIAPSIALVTHITGALSLLFVLAAGAIYFGVLVWRQWLSAGFGAALVVLCTFDMFVHIYHFGPIDANIMAVDIILISVALATLAVYRIEDSPATYIIIPILLFSLWSLTSGIANASSSYPVTGIVFGITQFRYVLMAIAAVGLVSRFGLPSILTVLLSSVAFQSVVSIIQSLSGGPLGLSLYGDSLLSSAGREIIWIGPVKFTTGLFTGGFSGSSRALLALVCLVVPPAFYYVYKGGYRAIPALICISTGPFVAVASRSENGYGALVLGVVMSAIAVALWYSDGDISARSLLAGTGVVSALVSTAILYLLSMGLTSTSSIRHDQYAVAAEVGVMNPGGIGGGNFDWYTSEVGLAPQYAEVETILGVHNTFFAMFAELGFPGLLLYLLAIIVPYWYCLRRFTSTRSSILPGLLASGMIAFHAFSFLSWIYHREVVMLTFWLVAVAAGAYCYGIDLEKRFKTTTGSDALN